MMRVAVLPLAVLCVVLAVPVLADDAGAGGADPLRAATVSLPLSDLRQWLNKPDAQRAPVDYVLSTAQVSCEVTGKTVRVSTQFEVVLLREGWVLAPLGPAAGVLEATVDDKPAALVQRDGRLLALLDGKTTRRAAVKVVAELRPEADGPTTRLAVALPPAPLVALSVGLDRAGLDARALGAAGVKTAEPAAGRTLLSATYAGAERAEITWRSRPAPGAQVAAEVTPTTLTRVAIGRGVVRYLAMVSYEIRHSEVETFRIALPAGVDFTSASGRQVRDTQVTAGAEGARVLTVTLAEPVRDAYLLEVLYEQRFEEGQAAPAVALLSHPDARADAGMIGLEVRGGGYELTPTAAGVQRVDVRELPEGLWSSARSPLLFGYRYQASAGAKITLGLTRHAEVDVLVAMCDVAEAATTITPDGKVVTKVMYVTRNNLKQFMALKLPENAQLWSAFVDDRPVTPMRTAAGVTLIPLRKSESVEPGDRQSYRAQRETRRAQADGDRLERLKRMDDEPADLKPYDVEVVYVQPGGPLAERGQAVLALPQSDVPVGKMAWAVFTPAGLRVVDAQGNVNEVAGFSLGFRHFAEAAWLKQSVRMAELSEKQQQMAQAMQEQLADKIGQASRAEGVLPVRVEIPIGGEIARFEKLLCVDEAPSVKITYARKAP